MGAITKLKRMLEPTPAHQPQPPTGEQEMSKPESYFTIKEANFTNKKTKAEESDHALFFSDDLVECEYTWGRYNAKSVKPVRLLLLKELAKTFEDGATEGICAFILKQNNLDELVKLLKDNKIAVLDFFKWVSENLPEEKKKTKSSDGAPTRTTTSGIALASLVNKMADMDDEGAEPNLQMRLDKLLALVNDEAAQKAAIQYLQEKLNDKEYGWNTKTMMEITKGGVKVSVKNPSYGQVSLKKS